jgi:SAM-dependent methyltransferase
MNLMILQFILANFVYSNVGCGGAAMPCNLNTLVNSMLNYGVTADSKTLARIGPDTFFNLSSPLFFIALSFACVVICMFFLNYISYTVMKQQILNRQTWDLNICCGKTDGGGLNVDIFRHADLPRFKKIENIYNLPFEDGQFEHVLCSHTIEHVEDPRAFFDELKRVGKSVTIVLPPLWDISAALNLLEHRHIFLTLKKEHNNLPGYIRLPLAKTIQGIFKQRIHA